MSAASWAVSAAYRPRCAPALAALTENAPSRQRPYVESGPRHSGERIRQSPHHAPSARLSSPCSRGDADTCFLDMHHDRLVTNPSVPPARSNGSTGSALMAGPSTDPHESGPGGKPSNRRVAQYQKANIKKDATDRICMSLIAPRMSCAVISLILSPIRGRSSRVP